MNPSKKHSGFTLVELLIVITIIMILATLSVFIGNKMLMRSRATLMASNMRQMAPLFRIYSNDHNDLLLPCKSDQLLPDNTVSEMIWHEVLLTMMYENSDPANFKTEEWWENNNNCFLKNPLFRTSDTPRGWEPLNPGYGYNLKLPENHMANEGLSGDAESAEISINVIEDPGRSPLIAPCDNYFYRYDEAEIQEFTGGTLSKFLSDGRFPVLFLGGQVEMVRPDEYISRRLHEMPLDPNAP